VGTLWARASSQACEDVCKKLTRCQRRTLRCPYDRENNRYDIPSDTTFFRVLNLIDPVHFEFITAGWLLEQGTLPKSSHSPSMARFYAASDATMANRPLALTSLVTHQLHTALRSVSIAEKKHITQFLGETVLGI
jgi:phenylpropionate dioxygenase-like ring-hydroxylating dioxygenase large terminal subunit